jgi:hypothetical protein
MLRYFETRPPLTLRQWSPDWSAKTKRLKKVSTCGLGCPLCRRKNWLVSSKAASGGGRGGIPDMSVEEALFDLPFS